MADGLLDVGTAGWTSRLMLLRSFRRVFADGDPVGDLPCTVSVRPRLLLPRP